MREEPGDCEVCDNQGYILTTVREYMEAVVHEALTAPLRQGNHEGLSSTLE